MRTILNPHTNETYRLPERDYHILLRRFNPIKAIPSGSVYVIKEECLCKVYPFCPARHDFPACPFRGDCLEVMCALNLFPIFAHLGFEVIWAREHNQQAIAEIEKVREYLLGLEKEK